MCFYHRTGIKAGGSDMQVQVEKLQTRIGKAKQHFERSSVEEQMQTRINILRMLGDTVLPLSGLLMGWMLLSGPASGSRTLYNWR